MHHSLRGGLPTMSASEIIDHVHDQILSKRIADTLAICRECFALVSHNWLNRSSHP